MKRFVSVGMVFAFLASSGLAAASPLPYVTAPLDTVQAAANAVITTINANSAPQAILTTCSGATPVTCNGTRIIVSLTGLTTAASTTSAVQTVNDASVNASSVANCSAGAGAGSPILNNLTEGAGTLTFAVRNTDTAVALTSPLTIQCLIFN